jgi:hypothetical protein
MGPYDTVLGGGNDSKFQTDSTDFERFQTIQTLTDSKRTFPNLKN